MNDDLAEPMSMTSSRPARRFDWRNLGLRSASAAVLIPAVIGAIWAGHAPFLLMVAAAVALLAKEWGGMSAGRGSPWVSAALGLSVIAAVLWAAPSLYTPAWSAPWRQAWTMAPLALPLGAALVAAVAWRLRERPGDAAFGVIYIGAPCLALTWLQAMPNPKSWTILLCVVTWSADIFAFLVGNWLKGPKLWPRYSPNKTWTGFFGGLLGAMAAAMVASFATAAFHGAELSTGFSLVIGLAGGLATMGGDLWESMLKRRYGVKDSGDLIPGHGGLLDRVDGLMVAALAVAGARLIHQIGWAS